MLHRRSACVAYLWFFDTVSVGFICLWTFVYLYSFDRFFGLDKLCKIAEDFPVDPKWKKIKKLQAWDLLVDDGHYYLCLWDSVSFPENYQHLTPVRAGLAYKAFFSAPALKSLHRIVETYYTTYKSVMRLFFPDDIQKLLEREHQGQAKRWKVKGEIPWPLPLSPFHCAEDGQTLIVFPDLRTMFNMTDEAFRGDPAVAFLSAIQTQNQKDKHRREIKRWQRSVILCTSAEIFQDFHDLKKIIFIDPHKRYYASQQDPRYKVGDLLDEMKKRYGTHIEIVGV